MSDNLHLLKTSLSVFQVLGSSHEFHFVHHGVPKIRSKRSVLHTRKLKTDPLVSTHSLSSLELLFLCPPLSAYSFVLSWVDIPLSSLENKSFVFRWAPNLLASNECLSIYCLPVSIQHFPLLTYNLLFSNQLFVSLGTVISTKFIKFAARHVF